MSPGSHFRVASRTWKIDMTLLLCDILSFFPEAEPSHVGKRGPAQRWGPPNEGTLVCYSHNSAKIPCPMSMIQLCLYHPHSFIEGGQRKKTKTQYFRCQNLVQKLLSLNCTSPKTKMEPQNETWKTKIPLAKSIIFRSHTTFLTGW